MTTSTSSVIGQFNYVAGVITSVTFVSNDIAIINHNGNAFTVVDSTNRRIYGCCDNFYNAANLADRVIIGVEKVFTQK